MSLVAVQRVSEVLIDLGNITCSIRSHSVVGKTDALGPKALQPRMISSVIESLFTVLRHGLGTRLATFALHARTRVMGQLESGGRDLTTSRPISDANIRMLMKSR